MFPNSNDIMLDNKTQTSSGTKSYLFDFTTGDFVVRDGKLIECDGISAIKVWIEKILRTEKGRYLIYDNTEYGWYCRQYSARRNKPFSRHALRHCIGYEQGVRNGRFQ